MNTRYDIFKYSLILTILFIVQRLFDCFIYNLDGASVLFGVCYLAFGIVLQLWLKDYFETLYYKRLTKKYRKILDKRMRELEEMFRDDSE